MSSSIDPTPLTPRPRIRHGALAVLLTLPRKWYPYDFIYADEDPGTLYRGTPAGATFANLVPLNSNATDNKTATAYNTTGAGPITAAAIKGGLITSTSAAAVALALPSATLLAAATNAKRGSSVAFIVDNSAGANTITLTAGAGTTLASDSGPLTIPAGTIAKFSYYFTSTTAAVLNRSGSGTSLTQWYTPTAVQQALSGAGAINLTSYLTAVTTTGANALTLANSTVKGQVKKIGLVVDGGDGTLSLTGYTSITFNDAGDYVVLQWSGIAWVAIENSGCAIV